MNPDYDYVFDIRLVGDSGVGKSSLICGVNDDTYSESAEPLIEELTPKTIETEGKCVQLKVWEIRKIPPTIGVWVPYRGCHGVIAIYDITKQESFFNITHKLEQVNSYYENVIKLLVGAKLDLESLREVEYDDAKEFADGLNISFIEISSKDSTNVEELFNQISNEIIHRLEGGSHRVPRKKPHKSAITPTSYSLSTTCERSSFDENPSNPKAKKETKTAGTSCAVS